MSTSTPVIRSITSVYQFPYYATQAAYTQATGKTCPPFDDKKPVKRWFDPNPPTSRYVTYPAAVCTGADGISLLRTTDTSGLSIPVIDQLIILSSDAGQVNIQPDISVYPAGSVIPIYQETQPPIDKTKFLPGDEIVFDMEGHLQVRNSPAAAASGDVSQTINQILTIVQSIAQKLGA